MAASATRFQGTSDFIRGLPLFAAEATTLHYASDHVDVEWFPSGSHIVEQNEPGAKLYLILSGYTDVIDEDVDGIQRTLTRLGPGEFSGELAIVQQQLRAAHVIAIGDVTCLVLAPSAPSAVGGRGADARLSEVNAAHSIAMEQSMDALVAIDVSAFVTQKIAAVAAHRTQYPVAPNLLPLSLLQELFGREYFVRVHPWHVREAGIWPGELAQRTARRRASETIRRSAVPISLA